ncbi:glycosyltransferase family 1 protein [Butyrivibrio sp. YAB3001]|uniref:glycosyltransferase family 1 protein n=1 Tax=Butyrivibrio sp. YAB3001 TaxID=1520812 RepID=UPI0008F643BC|nr:glycosyltransferase family 1 protein [Butyrivibrio sp. YAB3001]SFC94405.1 Glycosyltransferase involved in cell wall bisynthesis [Butyrivibrio sp. YAB3001]
MKKPIAIYGVGVIAEKVIDSLMRSFDIICVVDGNPKKAGTLWHGFLVETPDSLRGFCYDVVVTAADKYFYEITEKLLHMGVCKKNIYRIQHQQYDQKEELLSYEYIYGGAGKTVKNLETRPVMNIVMIFCAFYSVYTIRLVKNVKRQHPEIKFGVFSNSERYENELAGMVEEFYVYHSYEELENILSEMPKYTVFQFLWIENIWVVYRNYLRSKCEKMNLCIGGSDFYKSSLTELEYKRKLIEVADRISGETDDIINDFLKVYPEKENSIEKVNYGVDVLRTIDCVDELKVNIFKRVKTIPNDKIIITCGYNAGGSQQHGEMIRVLNMLNTEILDGLFLVFPMTYPENQNEYIEKIENELSQSRLNYKILRDFMDDDEMACLAKTTSIFLNVQKTDQLSSTMLEQMYAGSIVVTGRWLNYGMLRNNGFKFWEIENIDDLAKVLPKIVYNLDKYSEDSKHNKKLVYEMSSWEKVSYKWLNLWFR